MSIRRREHRHGRSYKGLHIDCNLPEAEWILLMNEVKAAVHDPVNSVVLEDPKNSDCWEAWLDDFIDGGIGERFFGAGMGKKWDFGVDRAAVRVFMRLLVLLAASREKTSNRRSTHFDSQKEDLAVAATKTVMGSQEGARTQRDKRRVEHIDAENWGKIDGFEIKGGQDKTREGTLFDDITTPSSLSADKLVNTEFVFQVHLSGSNKVKFLYANDTTSLQLFLEEVHSKFGLGHDQGIENFEAQIGNKIYVVDTPDERDWRQIMKIARGTHFTAEIVAKIMDL